MKPLPAAPFATGMVNCGKPIIAAIDGVCAGAGAIIAMSSGPHSPFFRWVSKRPGFVRRSLLGLWRKIKRQLSVSAATGAAASPIQSGFSKIQS